MVQDGVMREPKPDAVFGLHLWAGVPAGQIAYRPGPTLASSDPEVRFLQMFRQTRAWASRQVSVLAIHSSSSLLLMSYFGEHMRRIASLGYLVITL